MTTFMSRITAHYRMPATAAIFQTFQSETIQNPNLHKINLLSLATQKMKGERGEQLEKLFFFLSKFNLYDANNDDDDDIYMKQIAHGFI